MTLDNDDRGKNVEIKKIQRGQFFTDNQRTEDFVAGCC